MSRAHGEVVVRHPFAGWATDGLGESRAKGYGDDVPVEGAAFDPSGSKDVSTDGDTAVETQPTLYFRRKIVECSAHDEWTVRGLRYEQDGEPAPYVSPFTGRVGGTVVRLRRRTG